MAKEKCVFCGVKLEPASIALRGIKLDGLKCPKCGDKVFNEEQVGLALAALEQKRLKENYTKRPVKIGNSYGMIFPRDIVKVFNLDSDKISLHLKSDKAKNKIEITVL